MLALLAAFVVLALTPATSMAALDIRTDTPCPDGGGSCYTAGIAYIEPGASRFARWHEIGHAFDHAALIDSDRAYLQRLMRAPAGEWRQQYGASEWFADYYAACHVGVDWKHGTWVASYAEQPSPRRFRRVCNVVAILLLVRGTAAR